MTQVTKMLIQANTLQLTYLLYIRINVSNLSAYMSRFPCCHSAQYGIELFNYELIVSPGKPKPGYNVIRQSVGFAYSLVKK